MFVHREQIFYILIRLQKHGEDAVRFIARFGGQPFGYFLLDHPGTNRDTVLVIQYLKENLTTNIIWIITNHVEFPFRNQLVQIEFKEIAFHQVQFRIPLTQVSD